MASATQANQARLTTQASNGKKKARPKTRPTVNAARSERPDRATTSSAGRPRRAARGRGRERRGERQASGQPGGQRPAEAERRAWGARMPVRCLRLALAELGSPPQGNRDGDALRSR